MSSRSLLPSTLWSGDHSRRLVRWLFLRALAVVVFLAFLSLYVQVHGLVGEQGIVPVGEVLQSASVESPLDGFLRLPTLAWWFHSDAALSAIALSGMTFSLLLFLDVFPKLVLLVLWFLYLSLFLAGRMFTAYQWDMLITETLLVSVFYAPWTVRPGAPRSSPSNLKTLLMTFVLFKLMFLGGFAKLLSGDPTWWNLTALDYHFLTQPLPTPLAWFAHKVPNPLLTAGTLFALVVEVLVPFFLFLGRRLRLMAAGLLVLLQAMIAATGNYGLFNVLSALLCLVVLDDSLLERWLPDRLGRVAPPRQDRFPASKWWVEAPLVAVFLALNLVVLVTSMGVLNRGGVLKPVMSTVGKLRSINSYGLFASMTTKRREIIVQGSRDGRSWKSYRFPHKPDRVDGMPAVVAPHMPRLDWQMWFAALKPPNRVRWFPGLLKRILQGSDPVLGLFEKNPFEKEPPRYARAVIYRYRFSTWEELWTEGKWWRRSNRRLYFPPVTLRDGQLRRVGTR